MAPELNRSSTPKKPEKKDEGEPDFRRPGRPSQTELNLYWEQNRREEVQSRPQCLPF